MLDTTRRDTILIKLAKLYKQLPMKKPLKAGEPKALGQLGKDKMFTHATNLKLSLAGKKATKPITPGGATENVNRFSLT